MIQLRHMLLALLFPLLFSGCGDYHPSSTAAQPTRVNGVASKGIFTSGMVSIYSLVDGKRGSLLKQVPISTFGTYSANLGSYVGPVVAEASGSYLDEATGSTLQVPAAAPIRAALPLAQGTVDLPVTALTEIAVQKTGGSYTPEAIQTANSVVSDLFKVDIIKTEPVAATAEALNGASADQATYTLALATISQLSQDNGSSLATTLSDVAEHIDVATSSMSSSTAAALQGALTSFTGNSQNQTGITDPSQSPLAQVGTRTIQVTMALPAGLTIGGMQATIALPSGVTLNPGSPALTGAAVGSILQTNPGAASLRVGILSTTGFASGNVLTFTCSVPSQQAVPLPADFTLSSVKVLDSSASVLAVTPALTVTSLSSSSASAGTSYSVTLSLPAGVSLVGGVQGTVTLPAGFTLNPGSATLTGSAVGALLETNPSTGSFVFGIAASHGFASGPFLTFACTRSSAGSAPEAASFILSGVRIVDAGGATLPAQITVTVN
ncbi:hypothetical protein [Geomonas sp. Red32]|uniref:hypothetical protein n=1 Tax=Geomonas sp. Red32 TaxID=2912856 RepID=UPI002545DCA0|nr:hypothetical protein [Geomonas sp. Red32]